MKIDKVVIILLVASIVTTGLFFDSIVTGVVLVSFSNFFLNGLAFAPVCEPGEDPQATGCYDQENIDGGQVLNCLHGGACPIGVSWEPTGDEPADATPDSDPDPGDGGITASVFVDNSKDTDGDGIIDALDECVLDAETINGFLDTDGCPESTESPTVNELPEVTIDNTILNPPDISASFVDEVAELGFNANDVNLNDTVDSAIILVVVILVFLVLALLMILKKNLGGKKRK